MLGRRAVDFPQIDGTFRATGVAGLGEERQGPVVGDVRRDRLIVPRDVALAGGTGAADDHPRLPDVLLDENPTVPRRVVENNHAGGLEYAAALALEIHGVEVPVA